MQQQGASYEQQIAADQVQYRQLSMEAAMWKVRGHNVGVFLDDRRSDLSKTKDPITKLQLQKDIAELQQQFNFLRGKYEECLQEGRKLEINVAQLQMKLAEAVQKRNELQTEGDQLRGDWLTLADPYGQLSHATHDSSLTTFSQWIEQDADFAGAYLARGFAMLHLGENEMAAEDFAEAAKKDPGAESAALAALGCAYSRAVKEDEAQKEFGQAIAKDRKQALAYLFRGEQLARQGKSQQAEKDLVTATRLDEKCVEAFRQLAWLEATCTESGVRNGSNAVEHAEMAFSLLSVPPNSQMLITLAAAYAEAGDFEKSTLYTQKAREAAPENASESFLKNLEQLENKQALQLDGK